MLGIAFAVMTAASACGQGDSEKFEAGSDIVAFVNNHEITRQNLKNEMKLTKRKYRIQKSDVLNKEKELWLKTSSLNKLIQELLLLQEAVRLGIKISNEEFNIYLSQSKEGYKEEAFQRALEIEEISKKQWNDKLKNNLMIRKLIEEEVNSKVKVDEQALQAYFKEHQEEFQKGEQVRTLHIMVETEDEARRIRKLIRKGASFSDLAQEHSLGLEGKQGGDMGYFEAGQMPKEFDDVFKLGVNKVSNIIRTPYGYGYHIFRVIDKKPERKMSFEESRKQIHDKLLREAQDQAFHKWLGDIRKKAQIEINHEALEKI